jgi:hypothetical protein
MRVGGKRGEDGESRTVGERVTSMMEIQNLSRWKIYTFSYGNE